MVDNTENHSRPITPLVAVLACLALVVSALAVGGIGIYAARHRDELARTASRRLNAWSMALSTAAASPAHSSSTQESGLEGLMAQSASGTPDAFASTVVASEPSAAPDGAESMDALAAGTESAAGPEGPEGPAGADGPEGPQGPRGPQGSVGATGPAGPGLATVNEDGAGLALTSPDGTSYRVVVTNTGIYFHGPTSTQTWQGTQSQPLLP